MRLSAFVDQYRISRQISLRTYRDYKLAAAGFETWHLKPIAIDAITHQLVNCYLLWLTDAGHSLYTVHGRRTKILVLWRAACSLGYSDNWPNEHRIRRIKCPTPNPICWSLDELRRVICFAEHQMRFRLRSVDVFAGDYVAALLRFLHDSGMRVGDAVSMEFAWLAGGTVTWKQSKTAYWHRAKLSQCTLDAIRKIRTDNRSLIWPRGRSDSGALYRLIRIAAAGAGLTGTSKYIRRGVATDVYLRGLDPGRALGHVPGSRVAIRWYVSQEAQIDPVSPTEL